MKNFEFFKKYFVFLNKFGFLGKLMFFFGCFVYIIVFRIMLYVKYVGVR